MNFERDTGGSEKTSWSPTPVRLVDHAVFGGRGREVRARFDLPQEPLGFCGSLHRNSVGAIARGEIPLTFAVLLKLDDGLTAPLPELFALYERRRAELC